MGARTRLDDRLPDGWAVDAPRDEDAEDLFALVGAAFAEHPGCVLDPDDLDADLHAWASSLAAVDGRGWVARDPAGRVGAMVALAPGAPGVVELKRLYVASGLRRRGVGRALVELVVETARADGATTVELWTDTRFHDAHRLYAGCGFRPTGEQRDLHDPSDTTEDRMVLDGPVSPAPRH